MHYNNNKQLDLAGNPSDGPQGTGTKAALHMLLVRQYWLLTDKAMAEYPTLRCCEKDKRYDYQLEAKHMRFQTVMYWHNDRVFEKGKSISHFCDFGATQKSEHRLLMGMDSYCGQHFVCARFQVTKRKDTSCDPIVRGVAKVFPAKKGLGVPGCIPLAAGGTCTDNKAKSLLPDSFCEEIASRLDGATRSAIAELRFLVAKHALAGTKYNFDGAGEWVRKVYPDAVYPKEVVEAAPASQWGPDDVDPSN